MNALAVRATIGTEPWSELDELVTLVYEIRERDGCKTHEAAAEALRMSPPSEDTAHRLMLRGLANAAAEGDAQVRRGEDGHRLGRFQLRTTHSRERLADVLSRIEYDTGQGMKRLLDFTLADVRAFRTETQSRITSLGARDKAMGIFEAELTKHKAQRVGDLPAASIERIRKAAQKAWA